MKRLLVLALVMVLATSCENLPFLGDQGEKENGPPEELRQWAFSAKASSAYGGQGEKRDDNSPYAATGEPDVEQCGDSLKAWAPAKERGGLQWIELDYEYPLYVTRVRVIENFNPGALVKIELFGEGSYHTFWEGISPSRTCPSQFEATYNEGNYTMTPFKSSKVKLTLNTDTPGWNQIDAVELIGYEKKWHFENQTIIFEE